MISAHTQSVCNRTTEPVWLRVQMIQKTNLNEFHKENSLFECLKHDVLK